MAQHLNLNGQSIAVMAEFNESIGRKPILVTLYSLLIGSLTLFDLFTGMGIYFALTLPLGLSINDGLTAIFVFFNLVLFLMAVVLLHVAATAYESLSLTHRFVGVAKILMSFSMVVGLMAMVFSVSFLLLLITPL